MEKVPDTDKGGHLALLPYQNRHLKQQHALPARHQQGRLEETEKPPQTRQDGHGRKRFAG